MNDAFDRTDSEALRVGMVTHTFGAKSGIDLINLFPFGNGPIGALRFTDIAIDAFIRN